MANSVAEWKTRKSLIAALMEPVKYSQPDSEESDSQEDCQEGLKPTSLVFDTGAHGPETPCLLGNKKALGCTTPYTPLLTVKSPAGQSLIHAALKSIDFDAVDYEDGGIYGDTDGDGDGDTYEEAPESDEAPESEEDGDSYEEARESPPLMSVTKPVACSTPSFTSPLEQQPKSADGVPIVVEACLKYFNAHATDCVGLFRVPGSDAHVCRMWDYMEEHPFARMSINCVNVYMSNHPTFTAHDVSTFLKRFIKSLVGNKPVVTYNCYNPLVNLIRNKCPPHLIGEKYRRVLGQLLVPARRFLLARLCKFLKDFSKHKETTQMNCSNLAVCFANLMQPPPLSDAEMSPSPKRKRNSMQILRTINIPKSKPRLSFKSKGKKRSKSLSCANIQERLRAESERVKLCVSVLQELIEQSQDVFTRCMSPSAGVSKKI